MLNEPGHCAALQAKTYQGLGTWAALQIKSRATITSLSTCACSKFRLFVARVQIPLPHGSGTFDSQIKATANGGAVHKTVKLLGPSWRLQRHLLVGPAHFATSIRQESDRDFLRDSAPEDARRDTDVLPGIQASGLGRHHVPSRKQVAKTTPE